MSFALVVTGDTRPLDKVLAKLETFDEATRKIAGDIALEIYQEIHAAMLADLQFYPPVPAGSRYIRTFRLRRGWIVDIAIRGTGDGLKIELIVINRTPYTPFVSGALSNIDSVARATQRAFHARNGWPIALNTTRFWFDRFKQDFVEGLTRAVLQHMTGKA